MKRDLSAFLPSAEEQTAARGVHSFADMTAECMRVLHGGEWSVRIDHDTQMVCIRRKFPLTGGDAWNRSRL